MSLEALIADVLDVDANTLTADSGRATVAEWDSVAHLNVIAAVEETYGVIFSSQEMRELTTIGLLQGALRSKAVDE